MSSKTLPKPKFLVNLLIATNISLSPKKKIFIILALLLTVNSVQAHPRHYNYGYGYSGCSNCVYLLKSDFYQKTQTLPDCEDHSILIDTTINYYSNGAKRTYSTYSVVDNKKETIILSDYLDIKHVLVNNKHYFLAKNGREYKILNGKGHVIGSRQYSTMKEIAPNRFLVSINKLYVIIDINENIIAPIKYKSIEQLNKNLFMIIKRRNLGFLLFFILQFFLP